MVRDLLLGIPLTVSTQWGFCKRRSLGLIQGRFRADPDENYMAVSTNWGPFLVHIVKNPLFGICLAVSTHREFFLVLIVRDVLFGISLAVSTNWGFFFVLIIRDLGFGVHLSAPDCWRIPFELRRKRGPWTRSRAVSHQAASRMPS